jgi:hypothetical protein
MTVNLSEYVRFSYHGPCSICGHADARHRICDSIRDRCNAGDTPGSVALDFGIDVEAILTLVLMSPLEYDEWMTRTRKKAEDDRRHDEWTKEQHKDAYGG